MNVGDYSYYVPPRFRLLGTPAPPPPALLPR
jgi:hypothetical protein